jgi:hypothetical protein
MDEKTQEVSSSWSFGSEEEGIVADSIHFRVQHFYLHALSKILGESDTKILGESESQHTKQEEGRSQTAEITPIPDIIETGTPAAHPPWTSLPSIVSWYQAPKSNDSEHSPLRFLSQIARPVQVASESLFLPLAAIGSNLADAWDLRDLAEDLRFRGGLPRTNQGGAPSSAFTPPYNLTSPSRACSPRTSSPQQPPRRIVRVIRTCGHLLRFRHPRRRFSCRRSGRGSSSSQKQSTRRHCDILGGLIPSAKVLRFHPGLRWVLLACGERARRRRGSQATWTAGPCPLDRHIPSPTRPEQGFPSRLAAARRPGRLLRPHGGGGGGEVGRVRGGLVAGRGHTGRAAAGRAVAGRAAAGRAAAGRAAAGRAAAGWAAAAAANLLKPGPPVGGRAGLPSSSGSSRFPLRHRERRGAAAAENPFAFPLWRKILPPETVGGSAGPARRPAGAQARPRPPSPPPSL